MLKENVTGSAPLTAAPPSEAGAGSDARDTPVPEGDKDETSQDSSGSEAGYVSTQDLEDAQSSEQVARMTQVLAGPVS